MPEDSRLFLTPGQDHCLELHTNESLRDLADKASTSTAGSRNIRSFSRLFYARAVECDIDKQGRIRIPSELAGLADIKSEVVFIGVGFHWELWNEKLWSDYLTENQDAFEEVSQTMLDGLNGNPGSEAKLDLAAEKKVTPK